jgi:hypothetical protein
MKGWRRLVHNRRAWATSGRACSAASRVFFMAETEPVQPAADRGAMHLDPMRPRKLKPQFIQRQIALLGQPPPYPAVKPAQLAPPGIALTFGLKTAGFPPQLHHVIHEFRGNPEMPRRFPVAMPLLHKGDNPLAQLKGMWSAHDDLLYLPYGERES